MTQADAHFLLNLLISALGPIFHPLYGIIISILESARVVSTKHGSFSAFRRERLLPWLFCIITKANILYLLKSLVVHISILNFEL